ncbi:MAG: SH3 domain-containing protein [Verrucomicrobiota bacterium]
MKKTPAIFLFLLAVLGFNIEAQESGVVTESKINVRGKPSLIGEVVTQLEKGDKVTILEEIPTPDAKPGEPTNWFRIKLPENTPVWVFSPFVKDGEVSASRLNLRAGPGENYSVLGRIERDTKVKTIRTQDQWMEIEAPDHAYAFIDASLLDKSGTNAAANLPKIARQKPATVAPGGAGIPTQAEPQPIHTNTVAQAPSIATTNTVQQHPPTNTIVQIAPPEIEQQQIDTNGPVQTNLTEQLPAPSTTPVLPTLAQQAATNAPTLPAAESTNAVTDTQGARDNEHPDLLPPGGNAVQSGTLTTAAPTQLTEQGPSAPTTLPQTSQLPSLKSNEVLPRRIVRREGIVRATKSIQAPTWYELIHPETKKTMDYLHEERLGVDLKSWKGQKVVVTGEEGIDERWPNIPILELESIQAAP